MLIKGGLIDMREAQIHLINKMFNDKTIRTVWNKEEEKYYISVVDIVTALVDSKDPRHYWNALKSRLKKEGNETEQDPVRVLDTKAVLSPFLYWMK